MLTVPTSPMQRAYFTGINSDIPLGGLECVGYLEFRNKKLDISRLENALKQLSRNAVFNCQLPSTSCGCSCKRTNGGR